MAGSRVQVSRSLGNLEPVRTHLVGIQETRSLKLVPEIQGFVEHQDDTLTGPRVLVQGNTCPHWNLRDLIHVLAKPLDVHLLRSIETVPYPKEVRSRYTRVCVGIQFTSIIVRVRVHERNRNRHWFNLSVLLRCICILQRKKRLFCWTKSNANISYNR